MTARLTQIDETQDEIDVQSQPYAPEMKVLLQEIPYLDENDLVRKNSELDSNETELALVMSKKIGPTSSEKKLLHYTGKAIADFNMIQSGDRVMVCLSGGKDSFTLLTLLNLLRQRSGYKFELFSFTLDQAQPGWDDTNLKNWLTQKKINFEILTRDTYSIVKEKIPEGNTYCSLCSRLRRGIIYRYAEEHGFNKIALGHHRDDLIRSLMMSMLYNGDIRSMPPKLLSDNKKHIVIRPLCYVQEKDIINYANEQQFPIIPCTLCGSQENLARKKIGKLIDTLAAENPKIPSNLLHALQNIKPSQLMDQKLWNFRSLENEIGSESQEFSTQ